MTNLKPSMKLNSTFSSKSYSRSSTFGSTDSQHPIS